MRRNYHPVLLSMILLLTGQVWAQRNINLPRGTAVQIRLSEEISSEKARTGDRFDAILDQDISDNGYLLARRGDPVVGSVVRVNNGDRDEGDMIELTLTELRSGSRTYPLDTNNVIVRTKDAEDDNNNDAAIVGGGAGAGAIIGAIAGGLKGAIIGAAVGAGAGAATVLITDQDKVEFEPEQKFRFYLDRDVQMTAVDRGSSQVGSRDDDRYSRDDDDRYSRNQDSGNADYVRDDVRDQVSELDRNADHVWNMIRDDSRMTETMRNSSRESEEAMRLFIAISNFANTTEQVQRFAQDSKTTGLRGAAESLVRQAENIDQLLRSVNTFGHLQDDWQQVQSSLSRLANNFNLAYTPGGTSTYRAE